MPHGYFTIEQWKAPRPGKKPQWIAVLQIDSYKTLTQAVQQLERRGEPGLFRVFQMQRCLWGEMENGKLRLHGSHASSPENLAGMVELFEREGGHRPVAKARQERAAAKQAKRK